MADLTRDEIMALEGEALDDAVTPLVEPKPQTPPTGSVIVQFSPKGWWVWDRTRKRWIRNRGKKPHSNRNHAAEVLETAILRARAEVVCKLAFVVGKPLDIEQATDLLITHEQALACIEAPPDKLCQAALLACCKERP